MDVPRKSTVTCSLLRNVGEAGHGLEPGVTSGEGGQLRGSSCVSWLEGLAPSCPSCSTLQEGGDGGGRACGVWSFRAPARASAAEARCMGGPGRASKDLRLFLLTEETNASLLLDHDSAEFTRRSTIKCSCFWVLKVKCTTAASEAFHMFAKCLRLVRSSQQPGQGGWRARLAEGSSMPGPLL